MFKSTGDDPFKFNKSRTDPEELEKRLAALGACLQTYMVFNPNSEFVEVDLKRTDINSTCMKPMMAVKEFINRTGAGYENIYSPIQPFMISMIKNTQL